MKKNMIGLITVGACICLIIIVAFVFPTSKEPKPNAEAVQRLFIFAPENYHPEPQERMQYIVDTLSLPFVCALLYFSISRLFTKLRLHKFGKIYWLLSLEVVVITVIYLFLLAFSARLGYPYLKVNLLAQKPILAVLLSVFLLLALLIFQTGGKWASALKKFLLDPFSLALGVALILLVSAAYIFNEADEFVPGVHFVAFFDSVVQVFLGKTLLVDMASQYGLYALLLKPLFKIIGLSVLNFTLVMAALKALAFLSMFLMLRKATRNKLIAFLGFATILFFSCVLGAADIGTDPFFQYIPLRLIFPALFALLLWFYIIENNPKIRKGLYLFLSVFCALAVLWNSDTGLVVMLTWLVYVLFEELLSLSTRKIGVTILKCTQHLGVILGCTIAALAVFALYTFLISRQWPNFASLAIYTKLFYFYGFFMLPMRPLHAWNLVVLAYIIGLFLSISFLFDRNGFTLAPVSRDPKDQAYYKLTFALSVLGIGLFNYFVGRSHDWNLLPVSWVALILLTLFTDRLFSQLSRIIHARSVKWATKARLFLRHNDKVFFFLLLFIFFSSSALSNFPNLSFLQDLSSSRLSAAAKGMPPFLSRQIDFIKSTSQESDPVFILSDYAPELYLYSQHARPLAIPGFGELVLQEEVRQVNTFLSNPPKNAKIYWAPAFTGYDTFTNLDLHSFSNLAPVATSEDSGLILFESTGR